MKVLEQRVNHYQWAYMHTACTRIILTYMHHVRSYIQTKHKKYTLLYLATHAIMVHHHGLTLAAILILC